MRKRVAEDINELIQIWKENITITVDDEDGNGGIIYSDDEDGFDSIEIAFELNLPFPNKIIKEMEDFLFRNISTLKFKNCYFSKDVYIGATDMDFKFIDNCFFKTSLKLRGGKNIIKFQYCVIEKLDCEDAVFGNETEKSKGKLKLYNCELYEVNFRNTTFHSLVNFFRSTFYNPITFYKTKFLDTVVLSAVTFRENVLLSYTVINGLMMLRGTFVEKGFDISLAIINGKLSLFNFVIDDYATYSKIHKDVETAMKKYSGEYEYVQAYEEVYEEALSHKHLIPIENKRETYRIIKHQLESQKNYIDAIRYKVMESKTHFKESWQQIRHGVHFFNPLSNLGILSLNGLSNWFGLSYVLGIIFTVSIASFFFNLALSHIGYFEFTWDYTAWQWEYFVQFLNPTHRFDYMKAIDPNPKKWFFIWDFIGRIFISYGIYQTIQAFRKYK